MFSGLFPPTVGTSMDCQAQDNWAKLQRVSWPGVGMLSGWWTGRPRGMRQGGVEMQAELSSEGGAGRRGAVVFSLSRCLCVILTPVGSWHWEVQGARKCYVHLFLLLSPLHFPDALITNYYARAGTSAFAASAFLSPEMPRWIRSS